MREGARPTSVIVDLRAGESLALHGGVVTVELMHKSGRMARLRVTAPREVPIEKKSDAATAASHQACQHSP